MKTSDDKPGRVKESAVKGPSRIIERIAEATDLLDAIGNGISIQDRNFKILYENQFQQKLFGDHIGEYCYRAHQKREDACDACPVALTFEDGQVHTVQREDLTGEETRYVEITSSPLRDEEGRIIAAIEVVRDITEQKRLNELLKNERDRTQQYFDVAEVIMLVINADSKVSYINRKGCNILGYRKQEIIGKDWFEQFIPERIRNGIRQVFIKLVHGEIDPVEYYENPVS